MDATTGDAAPATSGRPKLLRHAALPLLGTAALLALSFWPVTTASACIARGLVAFGIAVACGLAGIACALLALRGRLRRDPASWWWMLSAALLALPALLLLGPLG